MQLGANDMNESMLERRQEYPLIVPATCQRSEGLSHSGDRSSGQGLVLAVVAAFLSVVLGWWEPQQAVAAETLLVDARQVRRSNSLLVSFTGAANEIGRIPSALTEARRSGVADSATAARLQALGAPVNVSEMIQDRLLDQQLDARSVLHPERLLQNFAVVTYESPEAATRQLEVLRNDPNVLYVGENYLAEPSWWPYWEPYYSNGYPNELDYQWGMLALRTYDAWDVAIGWGYVGVVDTGIATQHEEFVGSFARQMATNHTVPIGDPQRGNVDEEPVC